MRSAVTKQGWIPAADEVAELARLAGSPTITERVRERVQIVRLMAEGEADRAVAERLRVTRSTVGRVRRRYSSEGFDGLYDEERSGRPRAVTDRQIENLLHTREGQPPPGADHWSCRSISAEAGLSKSTVQRELVAADRRVQYASAIGITNNAVESRACLLVGIYLNPPQVAVALLDLPDHAARPLAALLTVKGMTHAYLTSRTTSAGTALDVANGTFEGLGLPRYRYRGLVEFLQRVRDALPTIAPVHVIMSDDRMYRHYRVREWLAKQPWLGLRYADGYPEWLDHLTEWFPTITGRALSSRERSSVARLAAKVDYFVQHYQRGRTPFAWVVDPNEIILRCARPVGGG